MSSAKFLGSLVDYLEEGFDVPSDLPMVYEKEVVSETTMGGYESNAAAGPRGRDRDGGGADEWMDEFYDEFFDEGEEIEAGDDGEYRLVSSKKGESGSGAAAKRDNDAEDPHAVVVIDSPLSSDPSDTRMEVEVVGIYTPDDDESKDGGRTTTGPGMAMVVVKKSHESSKSKSNGGNGASKNLMLKNLFDDSERKILRELERGLDEFETGRQFSALPTNGPVRVAEPPANSVGETRMGHGALNTEKAPDEGYFDAEIIDVSKSPSTQEDNDESRDGEAATTTTTTTAQTDPSEEQADGGSAAGGEEFAVRAARAAAASKRRAEGEDFAVRAAAAAAAKREEVEAREKAERNAALMEKAKEAEAEADAAAKKKAEQEEENAAAARAKVERNARLMDLAAAAASSVDDRASVPPPPSAMSTKPTASAAGASAPGGKTRKRKKVKRRKVKKKAASTVVATEDANPNVIASTVQPAHPDAQDYIDVDPSRSLDSAAKFRVTVSRSKNNASGGARDKAEAEARARAMQGAVADRVEEKDTSVPSKEASEKKNGKSAAIYSKEGGSGSGSGNNVDAKGPDVDVNDGEDYAVAAAKARLNGAGARGGIETARKVNIVSVVDNSDEENSAVPKDVIMDSLKDKLPSSAGDADGRAKEVDGAVADDDDDEANKDPLIDAVQFMPDGGEGLTPTELVESVAKFGERMDAEERTGAGFASGAFETGRELLRESANRANRNEEKQQQRQFREPRSAGPGAEEEELRRIFAAGERLAEGGGRGSATSALASPSPPPLQEDERIVTDEYVENLIASDPTVPLNARSLDDELAELEVRVSRTPGMDDRDDPDNAGRGPTSAGYDPYRPAYDAMSGPEAYDPNVMGNIEDAVNWPGAKTGTRTDLRGKLPRELEEATKQARFAAETLVRMREERDDDDDGEGSVKYFVGDREITPRQAEDVQKLAREAVAVGLIDDPFLLLEERSRLAVIVDELRGPQMDDRFEEIASNYRDLLLSDNFVPLLKERLDDMARRDVEARRNNEDVTLLEERHGEERAVCGKLVQYAQALLKQARALGAELEASHLEVIRSICKVAMDPSHTTEEETAVALTDAVRDMRPMFDESFVAYLKYAVAEEEAKLAREGVLDDPERNRWLFVLKIVQGGVYGELAVSVNRLIEHVWYVLRMESKSERRMLLGKLVDVMPTMDVRPFVNVVENIAGTLGEASRGEFNDGAEVLGGMTNRLLQLRRDVGEVLPPERIREMSRDADEWAAGRRKKLMEAREETRNRLKNARETEGYDPDAMEGSAGEIERIT
uniref:Uncharacterized protein n=1 Tax=Odontella aurita TaxID=265563 RepID=A0A7S4HIB7_9STRA